MCMERRRFSQTLASEWQTAFVVSHKMPCCALLTAVKNYNKSLEKLQDFFFKTETKTKTKCSRPRPRLHDSRPRLSFLSSRRLETVSRTTSLHSGSGVIVEICQKMLTRHAPPFQVTGIDIDLSVTYDFLLVYIALSRTVSAIIGDICKIFAPLYLSPPPRGFPLEFL